MSPARIPPTSDRSRTLRRGVWKAATGPLNLGLAAAASVGGAALGSWPLMALGGAAYAALVAWDLSSAKFWAKVVNPAGLLPGPITALPAAKTLASPELAGVLGEITAARTARERVVQSTPPEVLAHLPGTLSGVSELERRAAELLVRGDGLYRYLAGAGVGEVRTAVAELERTLRATRDPEARAQYESALGARREHLHALTEIESGLGRMHAHLTRISALLSGLPAKLVHLRTLDSEALDRVSGDLSGELETFNVEIASFEETLKALAPQTPD